MVDIPFQPPVPAGRTALPAQQPRLDRGMARRIGLKGKRRRAGDVPAGPGRAGPGLRIVAQHDHAGARPLRRQSQSPACRQIIPGEAAFRFKKNQVHSRTARGFQPGAKEIELAICVHDRQAGRIEAQQGKPVPIDNRLRSRSPPREQSRPCLSLAASAQGESQGRRLIVSIGMDFMQLPALQRRNCTVDAMCEPPCRTFPKLEDTSRHTPNRSYVPDMFYTGIWLCRKGWSAP